MQIVIDIDEDDFKIIKHNVAVNHPLCPLSEEVVVTKIAHGTPLPKGHGDLIDRNSLLENIWDVDCRCGYVQVVDRQDIEDVPTIIEADKESEEEK